MTEARTVYRFGAGKVLDQIGITGRTEEEGTGRGVDLWYPLGCRIMSVLDLLSHQMVEYFQADLG